MGRESGFLALESGVAAGAEMIIIPENKKNLNDALLTSIAGISAAMKNTG